MGKYTAIDDPSAHFQTATWSGNASTQNITNDGNSDLKPDFTWTKPRGIAFGHKLMDSTRGIGSSGKFLFSDLTNAEDSINDYMMTFNTDGFSVGAGDAGFNASNDTYVTWQWKANGGTTTSVSASGTGSGCVNACTYQANTTAGFSIITYTGRDDQLNNGQHSLLKHGLGVAPTFIILKRRDATGHWYVMGKHVTSASAYSNNEYLSFNDEDGINGNSYVGSVAPTATDIYLGNELVNIADATYVMYAFTAVQGYSKFGSYIGNGNANGAFVYTGFKPAYVMVKNATDGGVSWMISDSKRETVYNPVNHRLKVNATAAEATNVNYYDFLSNGFKALIDDSSFNTSGKKYIYMAFAENPFVTSTGIMGTAR